VLNNDPVPVGYATGNSTSNNDQGDKAARDRRDRIMLRRYADSRDPVLREALIERFMPLARSLAWRYAGTNEPMEDLVQVASEGLVKAIDRYDPVRANAFSSYATPVILGNLRHYFRDATQRVHVPRSLQESMQKVSSEIERAETDLGHSVDSAELVERTGLEEDVVDEALTALATRRPASLDTSARPDGEEPSSPLAEMIGTRENGYDKVESTMAAETVELDDREREALRLRFGHAMNQREIGERIGTSQMQVSRLLRRSLDKVLTAVQGRDAQTNR
jgi:RNA polymerase sigma-B factor